MINRITLSAALSALLISAPALAQYRGDEGWRGTTSVGAQTAYDRGYREGAKEGEKDARQGRYFEFERDGKYRDADAGYKREFGDRDAYRRVFRQGYATGYTDAYSGRNRSGANGRYPNARGPRPRAVPRGSRYPGGYPGYPRYPQTYPGGYGSGRYEVAREKGYSDGIEKGREDWRKNRNADYLRHAWYRSADRGFDDDRGMSKDAYRDAYREGFRVGYNQGYRQTAW